MKFYSFNGVTLWTNMSPKMSPLSKRNGSRARFVEVREREKEREGEREEWRKDMPVKKDVVYEYNQPRF